MNWQQKKIKQKHKVPYIYVFVLVQIEWISVAEDAVPIKTRYNMVLFFENLYTGI